MWQHNTAPINVCENGLDPERYVVYGFAKCTLMTRAGSHAACPSSSDQPSGVVRNAVPLSVCPCAQAVSEL